IVLFLFFMFAGVAESSFFVKNLPSNMSKMNFFGYLVFCLSVAAICYGVLYLLNLAHEKEFSFEYVFGSESLSIGHYFIYICSAYILYNGFGEGIEGNIVAWFMSFLFLISIFV